MILQPVFLHCASASGPERWETLMALAADKGWDGPYWRCKKGTPEALNLT